MYEGLLFIKSMMKIITIYHIGEKRLRQMVDIYPNGEFYLMVGNKVLIKKLQFEQFLTDSSVI